MADLYESPLDHLPGQGVYWDRWANEPMVVLVLAPEDIRAIADSLPSDDSAVRELIDLADAADRWASERGAASPSNRTPEEDHRG